MQKPFIIGITGGSGSGKTTFIHQIRAAFTEAQLCVISQDDYYRPLQEQFIDQNGVHNFDIPKSIDKKAFHKDILQLIAGETVVRPEYIFNNPDATPTKKCFKPAPILIVEGLFVFHYKKIMSLLDLKIFFYSHENLKIIRRIKRDAIERNYDMNDVLYRYEHHVMPNFKKYIEPYMEQADIIINNNQSFNTGLEVITGFLKNKLLMNKNP